MLRQFGAAIVRRVSHQRVEVKGDRWTTWTSHTPAQMSFTALAAASSSTIRAIRNYVNPVSVMCPSSSVGLLVARQERAPH